MTQRLVLVVDDNLDMRVIFRTILESRGFAVLEAVNGAEAVELTKAHRPDVIFMDIMMPDVDGWAAMELIRADPEIASIPVVAITSAEPLRERVQRAGYCAFLQKPLLPAEVVNAVTHCLDAQAEGSTWIEDLRRRISP